ncbi:hypothetical protein PHLCEN_2v7927 [Hermanssonia centrifuga]|uniref:Uncharacterized protein n=1 Tax=Hermanssonia centrifuga TaxID=98765 RepID=A0A2R6NV46_9APHY|nr:hypothetical protein PHLCEN_2v7927 [Hermanssonia centrifuga]
MAPETGRIGPYIILSQWVMERLIGELVGELRQPSNPYQNLAERAFRRAQVSALKNMYADLDPIKPLPRGALALSNNNYTLLRTAELSSRLVPSHEACALRTFGISNQAVFNFSLEWIENPLVAKWARLWLPNGQIARSKWYESRRPNPRISRNVKLASIENRSQTAYAEVQYYFKITVNGISHGFAMVKMYDEPDQSLLKLSSNTVWSCKRQKTFKVINVSSIISVVGMVPHTRADGQLGDYEEGPVFRVDKMGLDAGVLTGTIEFPEPDETPVHTQQV